MGWLRIKSMEEIKLVGIRVLNLSGKGKQGKNDQQCKEPKDSVFSSQRYLQLAWKLNVMCRPKWMNSQPEDGQ